MLNGDPGVYSARWAGPDKDFVFAMNSVKEKIGDPNGKAAHFTAVLALALPDGSVETFEGIINGTLVWPPRGDKGFGYDPMFVPDGYAITFGEMEADEKTPHQSPCHRGAEIPDLYEGTEGGITWAACQAFTFTGRFAHQNALIATLILMWPIASIMRRGRILT